MLWEMSFLEIAQFFGGQFRDEKMMNKWCHWFDDALAVKNGACKKDGMTELLMVDKGIFGHFFMDTDILLTLYYDIHNQQRPIGDMPHAAQHMTASSWKRAVNKFVKKTCDITQGHYHCRIVKNGQIYLGCLQPHGYIDYAFPLLLDDPHANPSLAARMVADTAVMVICQQPQAPASATQSPPTRTPPMMQPVPEATSPDVIIKEEIVEIGDDDTEQGQAEKDEKSAILSMIQVCQEADAPPLAPDTPCPTCATQGEASGEQSMDTKMTNAAWSLSLSYPAPAQISLSLELSQQLGLALGSLPNLEWNVQESVSPSKQVDLNHLRDKSRRSLWDLGKVWSDVTEYEEQKSKVEETSRDWSQWDTGWNSSKGSQSRQWEGSPKWQSKSRTCSKSRDACTGSDENPTWQSVRPKGQPPHLEWIPWVGLNFPAHLSLTDKHAFMLWAESYLYDPESQEVKALSFLPDYVHVAMKIITRVLWSMVYVLKGGSLLCPNSLAQVLQLVDPMLHQPPDSIYPVKITFHEDMHSWAWESWEETLSWIEYWWEAGYMAHNPQLFHGGNLRTDLPMVLFVLHHINQVLPESKPIQLKAVLGNTRWDHAQMMLQETDLAEVHHRLEKELPMKEVNTPTREYLYEHMAEVAKRNYKLLREAVRDADRWWERTIQKDTQAREQRHRKEKQQRQTDLVLQAHNWQKDKEHAATVAKAKAHA